MKKYPFWKNIIAICLVHPINGNTEKREGKKTKNINLLPSLSLGSDLGKLSLSHYIFSLTIRTYSPVGHFQL